MQKLLAFWNLFRRGEEIASPEKWKNGTIALNSLAAFFLSLAALAGVFGLELGMTDESATALGGGLLALGNIVMHIITSRKVGLPARGGGDAATGTTGPDHLGTMGRPFSENDL